jgi:hypothetical protein
MPCIVLYPLTIRLKFVMCPEEPLLKLSVPWIKQKITEGLLHASKEVGLEVNPEKTKYMLMSHCMKARQKLSIKIANKSVEDVAIFGNNANRSKLHA